MLLTVSHDWTWYFFEQRICQNPHNYSICRVFHSLKKENHTVENRLRTQPLCFFHFLSCPFRFLLFYFLCMFVLFSFHDLSFSSHAPFVSFHFLSFPFICIFIFLTCSFQFLSCPFIFYFDCMFRVPVIFPSCCFHFPFMSCLFLCSFHFLHFPCIILSFSFHVLLMSVNFPFHTSSCKICL